MTINFDSTFLSDLILDAKGLFGAFADYVFFLIAILIAFQLVHFVITLLTKSPKRIRKRF